jgi:hypothetical protein
MRFYIPNYDIYRTDREDGHNGETVVAVNKDIPDICTNLLLLLSLYATGVCIPIRNIEALLQAVYESPQRLCSERHQRAIRL